MKLVKQKGCEMEKGRMNISLTGEAADIVAASASERKRGEWISNAIVGYAQSMQYDDKGALERMEAKIDRILAILGKRGEFADVAR